MPRASKPSTALVDYDATADASPGAFAEYWPIEQVTPYARNPRKNANAISAVAASLKEFGFRQPLVVDDDGVVIVGHTRLEAARALGLSHVPVHIARGLTKAQVKAYRIADNRTAENADWDRDLLALEFTDLRLNDFDLTLTAFTEQEIEGVLGEAMERGEHLGDADDAADAKVRTCPHCGEALA